MHVALTVLWVGLLILGWAWACRRIAGWLSRRAQRTTPVAPAVEQVRPTLPVGHRPPPGLSPLSPSDRFLEQEAARGLHELQRFLGDERTV